MKVLLGIYVAIALNSSIAYAQCSDRAKGSVPVVTLELNAVQSTVKLGSPIMVKLTVKNDSDHEFSVLRDANDGENRMELQDNQGHLVKETRHGYVRNGHGDVKQFTISELSSSLACVPLKAGESLTLQFDVRQRYVVDQPGEYTIWMEREDPESPGAVRSNKVTINITK